MSGPSPSPRPARDRFEQAVAPVADVTRALEPEQGDWTELPSGSAVAALGRLHAAYDHVAHAVPSIADMLPLYRDLLGGRPVGGGISPWGGHLAVQLEFASGSRLELLEPVRPDAPSIGRFLKRFPRGGLHHITFKVDDIEQAIEVLTDAGYRLISTYVEQDAWKETFLHPAQSAGVLIQLAQAAPGVPGPLSHPLEEMLRMAAQLRRENGMDTR